MKPYQHARISAQDHGGTWAQYMSVHDLIDSTKAVYPSVQHRFLFHSTDLGPTLCEQVLGLEIGGVTTRQLALEHITQDLGFDCPVDGWIRRMRPPKWIAPPLPMPTEHFLAEKFGQHDRARIFNALCDWFDQTRALTPTYDPRHRLVLHNAFGIFVAEQVFGTLLPGASKPICVRDVGEAIVQYRFGHIPTLQEIAERIKLEPWMHGALVGKASQEAD